MRVVVADDEPDTRALCLRALKQEWPDLEAVEIAGPSDVDRALSVAPDLLVTDYDLHWIDGFAIYEMVKAAHPACHAIMFTGTGNEELAVRAMKVGFDDYLVKSHNQLKRLAASARITVERGQQTRALTENRDLVLAELYHRLHNNLQIVLSLIRRTEKSLQSQADRQHLASLRQRIQALIALQERFYRSTDFRRVDFSGFLSELTTALASLSPGRVKVAADLVPLRLPVDKAVPFGLLANELLTFAAQNASGMGEEGELRVSLMQEGSRASLIVAAQQGISSDEADSTAPQFDLHLVERLAEQIGGKVTREDGQSGSSYHVCLPL